MKSREIRKKFQHYFTAQDHAWAESTPLTAVKDPGLLFTNAGMNPFKDFFLGLKTPPHPQLCSIQKCLRAGGKHNDLEEVGHSPYHHTFFEMMGNFSFGSYFKKEAMAYALDFLIKELGLSKKNLYVSVFKEDRKSAEIWQKALGFAKEKIFFLGEKDNFWRMGETGPSGPCSEIYYYEGSKKNPGPKDMTEIWNLVFMEFNEYFEEGKKVRKALPAPCVDTGMGLERLSAVLQGVKNNYHTDIFKDIIKALEKASGWQYSFTDTKRDRETQTAFQVIADHARAVCFLIADGVLPGSDSKSYVLRRILRRALFYSHKLEKELLSKAVEQVTDQMGVIYPELKKEKAFIINTVKEENDLFKGSLKEGQNVLLKKIKILKDKKIPDNMLWELYSTYGFPLDLTRLIAREKGFTVNENFNLEKFKQAGHFRKHSIKENLKEFIQNVKPQNSALNLKKTLFTGYSRDREKARILSVLLVEPALEQKPINNKNIGSQAGRVFFLTYIKKEENETFTLKKLFFPPSKEEKHKTLKEIKNLWLITDKTCFYPEGGGPVGDKGVLEWGYTGKAGQKKKGKALILDCQKVSSLILHKIKILTGELNFTGVEALEDFFSNKKAKKQSSVSLPCEMKVDLDHRRLIAGAHSATHLLNQALKEILGDSTRQMGSLVTAGMLRFDFSSLKPLSKEQIKTIENKVNADIQAGHIVTDKTRLYEEAVRQGAIRLAGEIYEKKVRTIRMGKSFEFCGGIHVQNTAEIGGFKIITETGVQSGVRRITAYTGDVLRKWLFLLAEQNKELREYLHVPLRPELEPLNPFIPLIRKKEEEISLLKKQIRKISKSSFNMKEEIKKAKIFKIQGETAFLLMSALKVEDRKILADMADQLKSKLLEPSVVVALGESKEHKNYPLVVTVSKSLQKHISAGSILKNILAPGLNGKGGGQARFAQGTITNKTKFMEMEKVLLKSLNQPSGGIIE